MICTRRIIFIITVFILLLPVLSVADNEVYLPATGLATCYDESGNVISCSVTNSEGQDAEVMAGVDWLDWDMNNNRFTDNFDGTVTDRLTGLMWLQDGNCMGIEYPSFDNDNTPGDGKVERLNGLDFIKGINDGTYSNCGAGYTDWRLPNVNELESLVHAEKADTSAWLNSHTFMNVQSDLYWSSTWRKGSEQVLIIDMETGGLIPGIGDYHVLPVRAGQSGSPDSAYPSNIWKTGQTTCFDGINATPISCAGTGQDGEIQAGVTWPSTRFTDNFDGTMNDNLPELMWLKDANCINTQYPTFDNDSSAGDGMVTWQHALDFVKGINDGTYPNCGGGYTDWRLPNRKELRSLFNYADPLPGGVVLHSTWLMNQGFINVNPDNYWTSTTITALPNSAWRIAMADKEVADSLKTLAHYVWPVRDGVLNGDITVTDSTAPFDDHLVLLGVVATDSYSEETVTITNDGKATLYISSIGSNDPLSAPFSILNNNCEGQSLLPSESCVFKIRFAPIYRSYYNDTFDIAHDDYYENPVIVSVSGTNVGGGTIELPRTGRVWSYYWFDDGYFMAGVSWPSPRFKDNGDETVTDNLTGLMWTKNANLPLGAKIWQEALNFVAGLNTGNHSDWRLPNVVELESLIHADQTNTAAWLNSQGFQNVQATEYWSSTTDMLFKDEARSVNMSTGSVYRGSKEFSNFYVWGVRAGQTVSPDPAYPANVWKTGQTTCYDQTGTVISCTGAGQDGDIQSGVAWPSPFRFGDSGETQTDKLTGLIWATDADLPGAAMGFSAALAYIQGMNAGIYPNFGYVNWRLPNRKELLSLVDFSKDTPVLPAGHEFENVQTDCYWSSTVSSSTPDAAWTISMEEGFMLNHFFSSNCYVWPVVGGSFACVISDSPDSMVESNQADAELGISVSGAGDVNGDGYDDVIAGAPLYDNGEANEGEAFVYHGSASGIFTTPAVIFESNKSSGYMGISVSGAGDVNGDGYDDIIVGVSNYYNGESHEGAAFVYLGSSSGIPTTPHAILEANIPNAYMGNTVSGAGDVNKDGYDDVIVGTSSAGVAYVYHGSASGISTSPAVILALNQHTSSVSGAGDVNGDGYDDVIVGVPYYDNSEMNEGGVFVYHGSASGISAPPDAILEANQVDARMGSSVSGAGDVNNDGFDDIIVGIYNYTAPSGGKAHVYHGSSSGIHTTPATILLSNISNWGIANSVSGAGDVNNDGFDDIIIGAKDYLDGYYHGAAFVYLGGASGVSEYPGAKVQSDQSAELGYSVAGTGDVNGDGFDDVIVGSRNYDNGELDEGAAFVYHGKGCYPIDTCDGNFDGDNDMDGLDLDVFKAAYAINDLTADLDNNGIVNTDDLAIFAAELGRIDCQ